MDKPDPNHPVASQTTAPQGLRIIEFVAENVKRIEAIEIRPTGHVVEITGKNGSGKTSCLDAIWWTLAGASTVQGEPIRRGADEAMVRLDLGEMIVTRRFRKGEAGVIQSLSVTTPAGAEYRSPQRLIDTFFNVLSLDPLAFARMDTKARFALLRTFVPEVDFAATEQANAQDFIRRRDLNIQVRQARGLAAKLTSTHDGDLPPEPIDESALIAEMEAAGRHNGEIATRAARREAVSAGILDRRARAVQYHETAASLRRQAAEAEESAASFTQAGDDLEQKLFDAPPLPEPVDTGAIRERLTEAQRINSALHVMRQRQDAEAEADQMATEAEALTKGMEARTRQTRARIAAATMPVEGLSLTPEGEAILGGVPFEQASDAEQLRASIALAMALAPKLRVIRVRDGSLLDEDGMKLLTEMAEAADCQVWIERVSNGGGGGFELVAGRLRGVTEVSS